MRKFLLIIGILIISGSSFGQLTGVKNIPGSGGPNDYSTIAAAIADLNLQGVGPGGVTFQVAAGHSEVFPNVNSGNIMATGSAGSPVEFSKTGTGANPVIFAATGTTTNLDAIIRFIGVDYFTFNGIDLKENPLNTNTTSQMEWGFAFLKARSTFPADGCQYITIRNCSIDLDDRNPNTVGIYAGNHLAGSVAAVSAIVNDNDLMKECRFYNNTITNVFSGIKLNGFNDPNFILSDYNNEIGAENQGNTIQFSNISTTLYQTYGIYADKQYNIQIAYNTVTGDNNAGNFVGITTRTGRNAEIHHNMVSIGSSSGSSTLVGIDTYGTGEPGYTVNVHHNTIQNCYHNGTGSFSGIAGGTGGATVMNIYSNIVRNNTCKTGFMTLIDAGAAATNNIFDNVINGNLKAGSGTMNGIRYFYFIGKIYNNQIYNNSIVPAAGNTSSVTLNGIVGSMNSQTDEQIFNNEIHDQSVSGAVATTSNTINGIFTDLPSGVYRQWYDNKVYNLTLTVPDPAVAGTVYGLRSATGLTSNIYRNKVYNLTTGGLAGTVNGFQMVSGTQVYFYNNFISDLKAPGSAVASAVNGMLIAGGTNFGGYFNTIFLNAQGTESTFGSSGIYRSGADPVLDIRNNLIVNKSVPGASGFTVGHRWLNTYNSAKFNLASDANNYYCDAPDASHLIFYDGATGDQTIESYRSRVSPRESHAFSENSPLVNTTTAPYDLHIDPSVPTQCESSAIAVTTPLINTDIDGNARSQFPDVGAHEFNGTTTLLLNPLFLTATTTDSRQVNLQFAPNASGNTVIIVWNNTGYFTTPSGVPPAINGTLAGGTVIAKGTVSPLNHTGLTGGITYYYKAFSYNGSGYSSGLNAQASTILSAPSSFTAYGVTTDQINLNWVKNAQNNNVILAVNDVNTFGQPVNGSAYPEGSSIPVGGTVIYNGSAASFNHTALISNKKYYYQVWSYDGYTYYSSAFAAANTSTLGCGSLSSFPFNETFESYAVPGVGCGTVVDQNNDNNSWKTVAGGSPAPHGGTKHLAVLSNGPGNNNDWYFLQGLTMTGGAKYQLTFWYRPQYTSLAKVFEVRWGTAPTPLNVYAAPLLTVNVSSLIATYAQATCIISPETTGTYYIGWHDISPYDGAYLYLDDITITANSCTQPPALTVSNVTANTAEIAWTGGASAVRIDYGATGHAAGSGTLVSATQNPFTLTGLVPNMAYQVYVQQDCGLGDYSFWTGPASFTTSYLAPVVTTEPATLPTGQGITLNGTVNANGISTSVGFEYGFTTSYGFATSATPATATGTTATVVSATIGNLIPNGTTYHYRTVAFNSGNYTYGPDQTFVTTSSVPSVTTVAVTGQTATGATLNGLVNANNDPATVTFEYGVDLTYGTTVNAVPSVVSGSLAVPVSAQISGLTAGQLYHYRAIAVNATGTAYGSDMTFIAGSLPTATTQAATSVTTTGAVLNGLVNAADNATTVTFQYGTTSTYGSTANGVPSSVTGNTDTPVAATITGLSMNTTYFYRVVATNAIGTTYGPGMSFATSTLPTATAMAPSLSSSSYTLRATISWNNSLTTVVFQYSTDLSFSNSITYPSQVVSNNSIISQAVTGLLPGTVYNYRVLATNIGGTVTSTTIQFTTPNMPVATTLAATPVTSTSATLKGTGTPNTTTSSSLRFDAGLTPAFGTVVTATPSSGTGNNPINMSGSFTGLNPNTTYYYRAYVSHGLFKGTGEMMSFTTLPLAPAVATLAAGTVTPSSALVNGTVNAYNATTDVMFEYGPTTSYGSSIVVPASPLSGSGVKGVAAQITGLPANTLFHYRVVATNPTGTSQGTDMTFQTLPVLPKATTLAADAVTGSSANINAMVDANNSTTVVTFEYGQSLSCLVSIPVALSPVNGDVPVNVSASLSGLGSGKTYIYRVVASNSAGIAYGEFLTFNTVSLPLTGVKNIPGTCGTDDYPSIAAAIADLNLYGAGPGGVIFNIAAGYSETFQSPTAGTITATGSATSPVTFRKSGSGANPVIIGGTGNSTTTDGIIKITGGDYFTFDGIDLSENPANTTATTQMEWGYAMVKARNTFPVDGCQNITIRNCNISLSAFNSASAGIYSGNHLANSTAAINMANIPGSGFSDQTNNCRYYSNTISNVSRGFSLNGYNDSNLPALLYDRNTEIGAEGMGNTISNAGAGSNTAYGIYANFQDSLTIAYNSVTGTSTTGSFQGITPRVSYNAHVHHNVVSATLASGSSGFAGIDLYGTGYTGQTINVHHNTIQNSGQLGTGNFSGIVGGTGSSAILNIYSNTITGNTSAGGTFSGIDAGAANINNIYGNMVTGNTKTLGGTMNCIRAMYYDIRIFNNQIYGNSIAIGSTVTTASTINGIQGSQNMQSSEEIYNNTIHDLIITGLSTNADNVINGVSTSILPTANRSLHHNQVYGLSINTPTGSGTINGISVGYGNISDIFDNKIYNLQSDNANGAVNGVVVSGAINGRVYNNFISDLRTPQSAKVAAVSGIRVESNTAAGIFFNTIFLNAASTSPTFGTSGIYNLAGSTLLDLRNNLIMNTSAPGSMTGATVAVRYGAVFNGATYSAASNANNLFAGTPGPKNLIFTDGVNSDQTLAGFQTRVSPREALSFSEDSPLVNKTTAPYDLHVSTTIPTLCESGAVLVISPQINADIDGNARGTAPDVGAHEFSGIPAGIINPSGVSASAVSSREISVQFIPNPQNNTVIIVWNTTGYFTAPSGPLPTINASFAGGTVLATGVVSPVLHSGLTGGLTYYYKAFSYNGTAYSSGVPVQATTAFMPPARFNAYATASDRIDIQWIKNIQNQNVIVAVNNAASFGQPVNGNSYNAGDLLPGNGTVIYNGPLSAFSHNGLTAGTLYYYKAWSVDAYNWYSGTGSTANATTLLCGATSSLPFFEGFETYTPPAIGCGVKIDQNNDGVTWVSNTLNPHAGTKSLTILQSVMSNSDDWYFIQGLNLTGGVTYQLSFWHRPNVTYPSVKFEVKWGTSPTPVGMYTAPLFTYLMPTTTNYQLTSVFVTPPASGTYYFGWHDYSDIYTGFGSGNRIIIDDISVSTNSCPVPTNVSISGITYSGASIAWTGATDVQIDYGAPGHAAGSGTIVSTQDNPYTLTGLTPSTSYHVYIRQTCGFENYSFWTGPYSFTTSFLAPVVTTEMASLVSGNGATLNGTVNANNLTNMVSFEYGLSTSYGNVATATPGTVTGNVTTPVSAVISGLVANGITYHYRTVAFSNGVFTYGPDMTFITPGVAPVVTTLSATGITFTGATLNGSVNPGNSGATVTFEYGTDLTYGNVTSATPSVVNGYVTSTVSAGISGLTAGTLYHYRAVAVNASGTTYGSDMTFTAITTPTAVTLAASPVGTTDATLNGMVNAMGTASTVSFQYGTTTAYGSTATGNPAQVTGTSDTPSSAALTGLSMNTVYYYRVVAVNAGGTTYGPGMTFTTGTIPTVSTLAATQSASGVTINGRVSANNASTVAYFEYGLTTSYGSTLNYQFNPVTTQNRSINGLINSGLVPNSVYNFRAVGTNAGGTAYGTNMTFTTGQLCSATTNAATLVTTTTGRLNGIINPNGGYTNYRFEYGLTTAYGTTATPSPSSGNGTANVTLFVNLSGLMPNTTYHYRVYGASAWGTVYGQDLTFTTGALAPTVTTLSAYGVTPESAILNGTINANNSSANVEFEYGLSTGYGSTIAAQEGTISGNTTTAVSALLSGLTPNTTYNFRLNGTNAVNTTNGGNLTFTTLPMLPTVTTESATSISNTTAMLHGTVNAHNALSTVTIEYGLTSSYGTVVSATPATVNGTEPAAVTLNLAGLTPYTVYHYRVISTNAAGTSYGEDVSFMTLPDPLVLSGVSTDVLPCYGYLTGSVVTTVSGGILPYTFTWSNGATTASLTNIGAGTYALTVTDHLGTLILGSWEVTQPAFVGFSATITANVDHVCAGTPITFTAEPVNGGNDPTFAWRINNGPVLGEGSVFTYAPAIGDVVYCEMTSDKPCAVPDVLSAAYYPVVNPLNPVSAGIIPGVDPVCPGTSVMYSVQVVNGGTAPAYEWKVNGGAVAGTGSTYTYTPAAGDVVTCAVNSNVSCGANNPATATFLPGVNPVVGVTISSSSNPSQIGSWVTMTASPVYGGTNPSFQWYKNNLPVGTNSSQYAFLPAEGDQVYCVMTSGETCVTGNPATSNTIVQSLTFVPVALTINNYTVHNGQSVCFDARAAIVIAGTGYHFLVENGGSADIIAGVRINMLPGTTVEAGGYLHAWISDEFCPLQPLPIGAVMTGTPEHTVITEKADFRVYPNPTSMNFTVEQMDKTGIAIQRIEIYSMQGEKVMTLGFENSFKRTVQFEGMPAGIYFVRIIADGYAETLKIIKL